MRYRITLSYDGSQFKGWQIQNFSASIQESLQKALSTLLGEEISVTGAGRTDSYVNAINYIAHFNTSDTSIIAEHLVYKLNAILSSGIRVHSIVPAEENFHARFDARKRSYIYFIHRKKDPFIDKFSWKCYYPLDVEAMNKAAGYLLGTKDFSSFEKKGGDNKTSICTIFEAKWEYYTPQHVAMMGFPASDEDYIAFRISADRFLRNMVRAIVGSLIEVGRGRKQPEWIKELIENKDRCSAGESVPGNALFLYNIEYNDQ